MSAIKSSTSCLLFCMLSLVAANVTTVFDDDGKDYNEDSVIKSVNIHKSLMTVVSCDTLEANKPDRHCNVTHTDMQSKKGSTSCEFVLEDFPYDVTGHPFTASKAILISQTGNNDKEHYAKYTIVNFPDCKTAEAKIIFDSHKAVRDHLVQNKDAILINENDTFDVLYSDVNVCGEKVCRLTFDVRGNKVRGPIATSFVPRVGSIRRVKKVPSTPNFIVMEMTEDRLSAKRLFSLIKPDEQVVLKEYTSYGEFNKDHVISASHGTIRLCSPGYERKSIDCCVYTENGEEVISTTLPECEKINSLAVENFADGHLMLVEYENVVILMKFFENMYVGVTGFSCFDGLSKNYSKYENYIDLDDNEICITRRGFGFTKLRVVRQCLNASDFSYPVRF